MKLRRLIIALLLGGVSHTLHAADSPRPVGTHGVVGTLENPKRVNRLEITKPDVYENYLIDAQGNGGNTVKITADGVTLRNCEIRNGTGNGVGVFGTKAVIENCRIHHMLNGTFKDQQDAHGITGHWGDVTIRNCYVHGFNQPAQISTIAALNIKEHVDAEITHCVFADCEVAFRVRGPGSRGGAHVSISDCAIYDTQAGVRAEDKIEQLKISGLVFGPGVRSRLERHNGKDLPGFENTGERDAPPMELLLKNGFPAR